jgi:hypothetical protein
MSRHEVIIHTKPLSRDEEHILIALIARCGYSVYLTYDDSGVAFTVDSDEALTKIKDND